MYITIWKRVYKTHAIIHTKCIMLFSRTQRTWHISSLCYHIYKKSSYMRKTNSPWRIRLKDGCCRSFNLFRRPKADCATYTDVHTYIHAYISSCIISSDNIIYIYIYVVFKHLYVQMPKGKRDTVVVVHHLSLHFRNAFARVCLHLLFKYMLLIVWIYIECVCVGFLFVSLEQRRPLGPSSSVLCI